MVNTIIRTRFESAVDLADRLSNMQLAAKLEEVGQPKANKRPVVYVLGPDGTQFSTATLEQETLPDGSRVYQIILDA
jgi:hypothetical protein